MWTNSLNAYLAAIHFNNRKLFQKTPRQQICWIYTENHEKVRNKSLLFTFQNLLDTFNILAISHGFYHYVSCLTLTWFNMATTDIQLIYNMLKNNLSFLRASWKLNFQLYLLPIDLRDWQLYDFGDISKFASISFWETVLRRLAKFCMKSIGVCVCLFPIGICINAICSSKSKVLANFTVEQGFLINHSSLL